MTAEDRTQIVAIQPPECWAALRTADLGRVSFSVDGQPEIFPINYVVDGGTVVFRTSTISKIAAALDGRPVAFEADGHTDGLAWSVVVKGQAREVVGLYDSLAVAELPLHPQQAGHKDRLARITPSEITGRRFIVADPQTWDTAMTSAPRSAPE
jgi:uncharacterized protein